MEIRELAETVLFSENLDLKVKGCCIQLLSDLNPGQPINPPLSGPTRPPGLEIDQPSKRQLKIQANSFEHDRQRGLALHAFANHELLAAELMALTLLRFPDAPKSFRWGIAKTLLDELRHLKLYWVRMNELGVTFGDIPLNGYFWRSMSQAKSTFEFVSQMSLTFEQANLDFAVYFAEKMKQVGDVQTSDLLHQVYEDEIQHVAHGLSWFRQWKPSTLSDWDAFCGALPYPMTPARAKGRLFDTHGRKRAGLDDDFINHLEVFHSSKGRTPCIWSFNPEVELQWEKTVTGNDAPRWLMELQSDIAPLLSLLAARDDVILTPQLPTPKTILNLQSLGASSVEFATYEHGTVPHKIRARSFQWHKPWGHSEHSEKLASQLPNLKHLTNKDSVSTSKEINQKPFASHLFDQWFAQEGERFKNVLMEREHASMIVNPNSADVSCEAWLHKFGAIAIKKTFGSNGRGHRICTTRSELVQQLGKYSRHATKIMIEPWLDKLLDISTLMEIQDTDIKQIGLYPFLTTRGGQYCGTFLHRSPLGAFHQLLPKSLRRQNQTIIELLWNASMHVAKSAQQRGYRGPMGVDHLIYHCPDSNQPRVRPMVDINGRYSMGRIAASLSKQIPTSHLGFWFCLSNSQLKLIQEHPNEFLEALSHHHRVTLTCDLQSCKQLYTGVLHSADWDNLRQDFPFVDKLAQC